MNKYYYVTKERNRKGPFLKDELLTQDISLETLVWCKGMSNWKPLKNVEDLKEDFIRFQSETTGNVDSKHQNDVDNEYEWAEYFPKEDDTTNSINQEGNNSEKKSQLGNCDSGTGELSKGCLYSIYSIAVIILLILIFTIFYSNVFMTSEEKTYNVSNYTELIDEEENTPMVIEIQADNPSKEEIINARVEYMFKEVYENGTDGNSNFLTTEFKNLVKKEREVTPEGEIGWIDYNHWIQAQDCENPSMTIHSVEILSDATAKVMIKIKAFEDSDDYAIVELVLIQERGDWYIDDFIGIGGSEKQGLKDYITSTDNQLQQHSDLNQVKIEENNGTIVNAELKEMKEIIISLKKGETLQTKLEEITFPISQLIIKGNVDLSVQDWMALHHACIKWKLNTIDLHEMVGLKTIIERAFEGCTGLTSIIIPNSVRSIEHSAFEGCTGLTSIVIPNSVWSIEDRAFEGCTGLTSITISNSVKTIDSFTFNGCTGLTSITIPNSVTYIGVQAFQGCTGLTTIAVSKSVTAIEQSAFSGCTGLTSISVEKSNTEYDSRDNCNAIIWTKNNTLIIGCKTTIIPKSVKNIGISAFEGCTGLTSIAIPNSVTNIGDRAFYGCTGLTSIAISNGVKKIWHSTFEGCTGLTSIAIPNSMTNIEGEAFRDCSGLTSITIPNSTNVEPDAFEGCSNLKITRK